MPHCRDVVVVGASAGGVESLRGLLAALPADGTSALPAILNRVGPLPVHPARHGTPLRHGHVYTTVPDHHLLLVDALFRSAARAKGPRVIGVVLSGTLDDGAAGLLSIVARGGAAVVQDPADAIHPGMPESALRAVPAANVAPISKMANVITALTAEPVGDPPHVELIEARIAEQGLQEGGLEMTTMGDPSGFTCPDGAPVPVPSARRCLCRVGHVWTENALAVQKGAKLERALWTALRTLDEKVSLNRRLERTALERGSRLVARRYAASVAEASHAADVLRQFIRDDVLTHEEPVP